jgi:hypothetical protein
VWMLWRRENLLLLPGIKRWFLIETVTHHYTHWPIPAPDWIIVNNEFHETWKEPTVGLFKVLYQNLTEGTEENPEKT